jgi:hypothetical protein
VRQKDSTGTVLKPQVKGQGRVRFKSGSGKGVRVISGGSIVMGIPGQGQSQSRGHDQVSAHGMYQGQGQEHGHSHGQSQGQSQGQGLRLLSRSMTM